MEHGLGIYVLTGIDIYGDDFVEEILAYSRSQAWHYAMDICDEQRIVSLEYSGRCYKSVRL